MEGTEALNYDAAKFWFDVLQFILTLVIGVYVWVVNRHRVTHTRIDGLEGHVDGKLNDHEKRLIIMEKEVEHLPNHDDVGVLRQRTAAIEGDIKGVREELHGIRELMKPMSRSMDRINDYLLRVDKK